MADDTLAHTDTDYEALRNRVHSLKHEHQNVLRAQKSHKETESYALMQQRLTFETTIQQLQDELSKSQTALKSHVERSAKTRTQLEREKKAIQAQLDKITGCIDSTDKDHQDRIALLEARHMTQLQELQASIKQLKEQQESERVALKAEKKTALSEMEDWCNAEMEAVKAVAKRDVAEAREEFQEWQDRYEAQSRRMAATTSENKELQGQVEDLNKELEESRQHTSRLQQRLEETQAAAQEGAEVAREGAHALRRDHADQLRQLKAQHREQLDMLDTRVQGVLRKKDATIVGLREELQVLSKRWADLNASLA